MLPYLPEELKEMVVEFVDTKELLKFLQINHDLRQVVLKNGPFSKTLRELVIFADGAGLYPENLQICMKTKEAEYTFRDSRLDRDIKLLIYFIRKIRFCQEISIMSLDCLFRFLFIQYYPRSSLFAAPNSPRKRRDNGHLKILNFLPSIKNVKKWTIFQTDVVNLIFLMNHIDFGSYKKLTIGLEYPTAEQILFENLKKPIDCKGVKVLNSHEVLKLRSRLERQGQEIDELEKKMIQEILQEEQSRLWAIDYLKKGEEITKEGKELAKKAREKLTQEKKIWTKQKRDENRSITFKSEKHQRMKRQNFHRKQ